MLKSSITKAELQINQLKHNQLPPQTDFAMLQHDKLKHLNMKNYCHNENMTFIQNLTIMVQTSFPCT